jgi:hypothetical protein
MTGKNKLEGRKSILNQPIGVGSQTITIAGVAPEGFHNTVKGTPPGIIIPLVAAESLQNKEQSLFGLMIDLVARNQRISQWWRVPVARIRNRQNQRSSKRTSYLQAGLC